MQGRLLAGRYRLVTKLGQGGMGSVWRAEHLNLGTHVAIKLIEPTLAQTNDALARFQTEAQAAAELRSTHIVHVLDYGVDGGAPFIAMELLEGESLSQRISAKKRLPSEEAVPILLQVARALTVAHSKGTIHRDLKPDNIFIAREANTEVVKVLDFGVAKRMDGLARGLDVKTQTGALLGTPYYMSPEQASGDPNIDERTDIWSLGIVAYECITGTRPFRKDTLGALLMAICHDPIMKPSDLAPVSTEFDEWFARATARDRSQRFRSADEAAAELEGTVANARSTLASVQSLPTVLQQGAQAQYDMSNSVKPTAVTSSQVGRKRSRRFIAGALFVGIGLVVAIMARRFPHSPDHATQDLTTATPTPEAASQAHTAPEVVAEIPSSIAVTPADMTGGSLPPVASSTTTPARAPAPRQVPTKPSPVRTAPSARSENYAGF